MLPFLAFVTHSLAPFAAQTTTARAICVPGRRRVLKAQTSSDRASPNTAIPTQAQENRASNSRPLNTFSDDTNNDVITAITSEIRAIPSRPVFFSFLAAGLTSSVVLLVILSSIVSYVDRVPFLGDIFQLVR